MHSNQQLVALLEYFCAKLLNSYKKFDSEIIFVYYYTIIARSAC